MVKIRIPLPPDSTFGGEAEWIWADDLGNGLYRVRNVPFFAKGFSFDDVIRAETQDSVLAFRGVARHSGHSTYRIFASGGRHQPEVVALLERLQKLHCTYEAATEKLVGIDVRPDADIHEIYRILEQAEENDIAAFDEGHCGHPLGT